MPCLLIVLVGSDMIVLGAALVDNPIVQPIIPWIHLYPTRDLDHEQHVYKIVCILDCVVHAITEPHDFYQKSEFKVPDDKPFSPYIDSYSTSEGLVNFEYEMPLQLHNLCVTFAAHIKGAKKTKLVIKFISIYRLKVHQILAKQNWVPKLYFFGSFQDVMGIPVEGLNMVVMEFVDGKMLATKYPSIDITIHIKEHVRNIIKKLGSLKLVHGDIHRPNIIEVNNGVKILDFD